MDATTVGGAGDGVLSDGGSYTGNPAESTTRGAFIHTSGTYDDFVLKFDGVGGRMLLLDFGALRQPGTCAPKLSCRKISFEAAITRTPPGPGVARAPGECRRQRPRGRDARDRAGDDSARQTEDELPRPERYTLRYNTRDYEGSSYVYVTRLDANTRTISAGGYLLPADAGVAERVGSTDGSRNLTHEGWHLMPFSITVKQ